jgi:hypothetical protein
MVSEKPAYVRGPLAASLSPLARRIFVTLLTGVLAYAITNLVKQPQIWSITLSVFLGGIALVTQVLLEFEKRVNSMEDVQRAQRESITKIVEDGFSRVNEATQLLGAVGASALDIPVITGLLDNATRLGPAVPPLVKAIAETEVTSTSQFLKQLVDEDATYDGEDRDWLLSLVHNVTASVDATSTTTVDGNGAGFDEGFWLNDLGQRYLEAQGRAVRRGVTVRRIFILDDADLATDPDFVYIARAQAALNIQVRHLVPDMVPPTLRSSMFDFVLFDGVISYEVTPAARLGGGVWPTIVNTRLILRHPHLTERSRRFEELWAASRPVQ